MLPANRIFTYQTGEEKGSYCGFADLFRSHLLWQKGGWWADLDVICLKPFEFTEDYVIASSYEGKWGSPAINCVLKMPVGSELAEYLCREADARDPKIISFAETGPLLLQSVLRTLNLEELIVSHELFCPISWRSVTQKIVYQQPDVWSFRLAQQLKVTIRSVVKPQITRDCIQAHSYAVHLWSEIWRRKRLDKNWDYHQSCLYERLKHQYS